MGTESGDYLRSLREQRQRTRYDLAACMASFFPQRSLETIATDAGIVERLGVEVLGEELARKRVPLARVLHAYLVALELTSKELEQLNIRAGRYSYGLQQLIAQDFPGASQYPQASSAGTHSAA